MKILYLSTLLILTATPDSFSGSPQQLSDPHSSRVQSAGNNQTVQNPGGAVSANAVAAIFSDNFDGTNDTTSLKARGYLPYYRGEGPMGLTAAWYQGTSLTFDAYNGPVDGYLAANYNSVVLDNDINNWLVLPALSLSAGDILSFYSRSPDLSTHPDSLHIWYSATGDSTPEGLTWVLLGEFQVTILGSWELKTFIVPSSGATARLAIQYAVINSGPQGVNGDFVGIDQLEVNAFTGISENSISNRVKIFPNPATGIFYLSSLSNLKNSVVDVYNSCGQKISSTVYDDLNLQKIDLSAETNGIYRVRIISGSIVENHSIVINR